MSFLSLDMTRTTSDPFKCQGTTRRVGSPCALGAPLQDPPPARRRRPLEVSTNGGYPKNGWFRINGKSQSKMDDVWGYPYDSGNHQLRNWDGVEPLEAVEALEVFRLQTML